MNYSWILIVLCFISFQTQALGIKDYVLEQHINSFSSYTESLSGLSPISGINQEKLSSVNIEDTDCSDFIYKHYGLHAKKLCLIEEDLFLCRSEYNPLGAKIPKSFTNIILITATPLQVNCKSNDNPSVEAPGRCSLSDHEVFSSLVQKLSFSKTFHSCFCNDSKGNLSLALCLKVKDEWVSTSEFSFNAVKKELDDRCTTSQFKENPICTCNSVFKEDHPLFWECLSSKTKG